MGDDYRGHPFDVGNVDFPWGIGQDKFGQSSRTAPQYADSPEVFKRLCETLWMYSDRLFAQAAHLIFWFSIARYSEVHDRLVGMGWEVNPHPFIWVKPTAGIVPRPGHDLRQAYEAAFICTRGGRMLSTKRNGLKGDPPELVKSVLPILLILRDLAASVVYAFYWDWRRAVYSFFAALTLTVTI